MRIIRDIAKRIRDRFRKTPPLTLFAVVISAVFGLSLLLLVLVAVFAPPVVTTVTVGLIAAVTLTLVALMWLSLDRRVRALQAGGERVEVTQRRILAAIEQQRLDALIKSETLT